MSLEQRMLALSKANAMRSARGKIKQALRELPQRADGWAECARLIADPPEEIRAMLAAEIVGACQRTGPSTLRKLLERSGVSHIEKVGDLTVVQRDALIATLLAPTVPRLQRVPISEAWKPMPGFVPIDPFREFLEAEKAHRGATNESFGEALGVGGKAVARWLNENKWVDISTVDAVLVAMGRHELLDEMYPLDLAEAA